MFTPAEMERVKILLKLQIKAIRLALQKQLPEIVDALQEITLPKSPSLLEYVLLRRKMENLLNEISEDPSLSEGRVVGKVTGSDKMSDEEILSRIKVLEAFVAYDKIVDGSPKLDYQGIFEPHDGDDTLVYDGEVIDNPSYLDQVWVSEQLATSNDTEEVGGRTQLPSDKVVEVYNFIIMGFIDKKADVLSDDDRRDLQKLARIFVEIQKDCELLSEIKSRNIRELFVEMGDVTKLLNGEMSYEIALKYYIDSKLSQLKDDGGFFASSGYSGTINAEREVVSAGHVAFCRFYLKGDRCFRVDYNAGDESMPGDSDDTCMSVYERELVFEDESERDFVIALLLRINAERRLRAFQSDGVEQRIEYLELCLLETGLLNKYTKLAENGVAYTENSLVSESQLKGNCKSRSLREVMRANLNPDLFNKVMDFIRQDRAEFIDSLRIEAESRPDSSPSVI